MGGFSFYTLSAWVVPILLAVTLHEAAHAYVARWRGDDTAYLMGRVSLNPLKHIDPFGTVILPALLLLAQAPLLFGYAKPVPVRFGRLRNPKMDMVLVAIAGPGANLLLAFLSALLAHAVILLPGGIDSWTLSMLSNSLWLNLVLAVFNMLPLLPLDGGRVLVGLLPPPLDRMMAGLERYGMVILLGLLLVLPILGGSLGLDLHILRWIVGPIVRILYDGVLILVGLR